MGKAVHQNSGILGAPAKDSSQNIIQWLFKRIWFVILKIWDTEGVCGVFYLLKEQ